MFKSGKIVYKTEQFLAEFFKKSDVVEVNADELQRLIRKSRVVKVENDRLCKEIGEMRYKLNRKDEQIRALQAKTESALFLDLSA